MFIFHYHLENAANSLRFGPFSDGRYLIFKFNVENVYFFTYEHISTFKVSDICIK